jgi:excisionase family DNA binding protein
MSDTTNLNLPVPAELLEAIAQRAAEILRAGAQEEDHWMTVEEAAEYVRCPKGRLYEHVSRDVVPYERDGRRLLFRRSELDIWVRNGGAKRLGK